MLVAKEGYCLRICLGFFAPLRMTVWGPRPPSFPWRREPTPPLDDRSPIGVEDKLRIKCGAGVTGMTVEAHSDGVGGSLDSLLVRLC